MRRLQSLIAGYIDSTHIAANGLGPIVLLLMRVWVALAFWHAGLVKFDDPYGTKFLFNTMYQVPLLSPDTAALLGTWIELIAPWLLGLGLAARPTAAFLFVYNIIVVISYPSLWPRGFWAGLFGGDFNDHKIWAMMLLAVIAWGPERLSLDHGLARLWSNASRSRPGRS
ncbi:MAG: DoxX family protein [Rhodanobacter sp.]|uniref:DoxX family protein n=1 Tax=Rhodanobacter sp. FW021-MT20 TaxID=1162282 RepID=UPI000260DF56|nr:DoxX family protein [Rhodanobacter sp. 115]EIL95506.1 NADH dehydrogenase [Rhodanobacter sp. 115]TAM26907.1 MAG: DoxX family protein [Rhodanobacter sp.]HWU76452.1 DoxX family protein [Rhodanobacter sp.]